MVACLGTYRIGGDVVREKIYKILNKAYGILMTTSFFAGFLPIIPFIIAIIIGGSAGEAISIFLYKQYYPCVIILGSVAIIVGLAAMYVGKIQGLSVKKTSADESKHKSDKE